MRSNYGFGKEVALTFDAAVSKVMDELAKEGFGVLTDIDVAATMKKKLGRDMPPYRILGACNPPFAAQAIDAEPSIGLLMPCNVVVREDAKGVHVELLDPIALFELAARPDVAPLAREVRARLDRVLAALWPKPEGAGIGLSGLPAENAVRGDARCRAPGTEYPVLSTEDLGRRDSCCFRQSRLSPGRTKCWRQDPIALSKQCARH